MICGVMQMNRGTKTITLHSNQQRGERITKTKASLKPSKFFPVFVDQETPPRIAGDHMKDDDAAAFARLSSSIETHSRSLVSAAQISAKVSWHA